MKSGAEAYIPKKKKGASEGVSLKHHRVHGKALFKESFKEQNL